MIILYTNYSVLRVIFIHHERWTQGSKMHREICAYS